MYGGGVLATCVAGMAATGWKASTIYDDDGVGIMRGMRCTYMYITSSGHIALRNKRDDKKKRERE